MDLQKTFIELTSRHQPIINKVCRLYTNNEQDRKDLFQEISLAAWKGYKNFRAEAKFSTWLYRVALNTAITFYRKERKQVPIDPLPETFIQQEVYADGSEAEKVTAMYEAINHLSAIDKALVMLYIDDYSYADIAEIIGITPNNVAVKMNRIKTKLRETTSKTD